MISELFQISFEFFVTTVWDRYGPVVGILSAIVILVLFVGLGILAFIYIPRLATVI
ncbi:hypothetical protein [Novosphingobium sp. Gsoil 351]|uniref:hypothetical protein n=1 Tax=Novosphingobium sp. Gsoil 351 TaxID=2675225 RepID=UPI0012B48B46|nr:hypothetical protein [Novosphingobium sp. Gsoil 351]QGN55613.1 hypothetical protein GKE62_14745 [Novosphingobium sp. Gsoil 351]